MPSTKSLVLAFALVVTPAAHAAKFGLMGYENKADKGLSGLATIKAVNTGGVQIKGVLTAPETAGQQGPALMFVGQGTDCNAECTGEGAGGHDTFCLGGPPMGSENSWKVAGCQYQSDEAGDATFDCMAPNDFTMNDLEGHCLVMFNAGSASEGIRPARIGYGQIPASKAPKAPKKNLRA